MMIMYAHTYIYILQLPELRLEPLHLGGVHHELLLGNGLRYRSIYLSIYLSICIQTNHMYINTYIHIYLYTHCVCIYIYMYMYICIYIYIYIYI